MKICDILSEDLIISELKEVEKQNVLGEMVAHLTVKVSDINFDELLNILMERETLGSTGIGDGVAIPHGKMKGIQKIIALFGKSSRGVEFDAMDGKPVHLFFLLIAPENSAGVHLKALARLSRLLKNNGFRQRLMGASDAKNLYDIIIQEDEKTLL